MASEVRKIYEFGSFRFDAQRLRLEHDGEAIQLPAKSLEALKVLLEERGETVERRRMLETVWAESFVEDANLTVAISVLRKTFSAFDANEIYIQTVPSKGYRFVADAEEIIEVIQQPIIVESHALERITIEQKTQLRFSKVFIAAALLLLVAVGGFGVWHWQGNSFASNQPDKQAAIEAFSRGEEFLQKRHVCESIPYFREAIAKNEKFAHAYSNLAAALAMCGDATDEADTSIAKALALDPNLAEAHATDGFIKLFRHWDWDGAEAALRRAVALDPNSAKAHHWLGVSLSIRGRLNEAKGEMARAIEIEPNSPLYHADLCQVHYFERNDWAAVNYCQKALELDPNFIFTPLYLRGIYLLMGDEQKAWEYEAKYWLAIGDSPEKVKQGEEIVKRRGLKGIYESRIRGGLDAIKTRPSNLALKWELALAYAGIGDKENALYWIEQTVSGKKGVIPFGAAYLGVEPHFAFLRGDPRFQAVLRKMHLRTD